MNGLFNIGHLVIDLVPLVPWSVIGILAAFTFILVLTSLIKRARGGLMRALAAAVILLLLLNPALREEQREPVKDVALVVIDKSASMSINNRNTQRDELINQLKARLDMYRDLDVQFIEVDPRDNIDETQLFKQAEKQLSDLPTSRLAGTIFITDGQVHDVPEKSDLAAAPIHTILVGKQDEYDRRIAVIEAPSYGLVGKSVPVTIRVIDPAQRSLKSEVLTIRRDTKDPETMTLPVNQDITIDFDIDHAGQNILEIDLPKSKGELTHANNKTAVVVNGVRDRLRVLLVSGSPHPGERTWRNILKSDPSVDLVHFTILRPPNKQDATPIHEVSLIAFPIRELFEVKIEDFDLIIFDRYIRRGVLPSSYMHNIVRYVQNGGAFLEASGPSFATPNSLYATPLGTILPGEPTGGIFEEPLRPKRTDIGLRHPITASLEGEKNWGHWFRQLEVMNLRGTALMEGVDGNPLLLTRRMGDGRIAQLASDHMWLWSRGYEGGGPQVELLRRIAHWLMKEPELEEEDLRAVSNGATLSIIRRSLEEEAAGEVTLTTPTGDVQKVMLDQTEPGKAMATLDVSEPGLYRISDGKQDALQLVGRVNPPELTDVRTSDKHIKPIAEQSGGGIFWTNGRTNLPEIRRTIPGRDTSGRNWFGLRQGGDYIVTGLSIHSLFPIWLALALALGTLVLAWRREGQ